MTTLSNQFRKSLIHSSQNLRTENWQVSSDQVNPQCTLPWSVRKIVLHGGKQEGVDLISVDNGKLSFVVIPTRGMGLLKAEMNDIRLGWNSPVKEVVHPQYINLDSRGGLGWLEGFNEWVVRCGLESAGAPGRDSFITNTGATSEMELTLHGKIANIPASEVEVIIDKNPPHRIRVRGKVIESMMFGPRLELQTEISTMPGSNSIRIHDVVTNRGGSLREFQLIYHCNYGSPLLEEGTKLVVPARRVFPINQYSSTGIESFEIFEGPVTGFVEQVYCMETNPDQKGMTSLMLRNYSGDRAVKMSYSVSELPCLTLWKNTASVEEGYVTGIEPGTGFPYNRRIERKFGRVPQIGPGESRSFQIEFAILDSEESVIQESNLIEGIQSNHKCTVDLSPPTIE